MNLRSAIPLFLTAAFLAPETLCAAEAVSVSDTESEVVVDPLLAEGNDRWYQVELIVFRQVDPAAAAVERWPEDPGRPDFDHILELLPPDQPIRIDPDQVAALATSFEDLSGPAALAAASALIQARVPYLAQPEGELADELAGIDRATAIEPLVYRSWIQPGLSRDRASRVLVSDLPLIERPLPEDPESEAGADAATEPQDEIAAPAGAGEVPAPRRRFRVPEALNYDPEAPESLPLDQIAWESCPSEPPMPMGGERMSGDRDQRVAGDGPEPCPGTWYPTATLLGTARIYRERYLHLDLDLLFRSDIARHPELMRRPPPEIEDAPEREAGRDSSDRSRAAATDDDSGYRVVSRGRYQAPDHEQAMDAGPVTDPAQVEIELPPRPEGIVFRMQQSRRMRSNEMHYLDHPVLGVLVLVNELPDPLEADDEDD